ncbi:MAG: hypothetical protein HY398_00675 [Candidatus Doudnabacteria bacterium]|nr:hypothetical protein [Candidatus Doudnabacteria bacterium]
MQRIAQFFSRHYLAVVLAILVGVAVVFPQIQFIFQAGGQYHGFNIFETDGEYYYDARIREIYDGHYLMSNPLLAGKDLPFVYSPLPEFVMGMTGRILHLNLIQILILFRFLAPAGLFLLIYFLILRLTNGRKPVALLAATFILLASNLVSYPGQLFSMLRGTFHAEQFTDFARPVNPQLSAFFFFGFLYAYWRLIETNQKKYFYWSLIIYGLSFYVYQYSWTFLTVFLGLNGALFLWQKKKALFKKTLLVFGGGLVLATPYFINFYRATQHFSYQNLVLYNGLYQSHKSVFSLILLAAIILLVPLYKLAQNKNLFWFFAALVASGWVVINQQVITGQAIQLGHYHWYFNRPVFILLAVIVFFSLLRRASAKQFYQYAALGIAAAVAFFNVYQVQATSYRHHFETYLKLQDYYPVIDWLNKNATRDQVAYIPESRLNQLVPMYTSLNVYYDVKAPLSLQQYKDYDRYNLFLKLKLQNVSPKDLPAHLRANEALLAETYGIYFKSRGLNYQDVPEEWLVALQKDYEEFYKISWEDILTKYPLGYIIWDKTDLADLPLEKIVQEANFKPVYDSGGVVIYQKTSD